MARPAARRHGLTLLELSIALALTVLLTSLAAPSVADWMARNRLRAVAQDLATDLGEARQEAARLARPVHVVFRPGTGWCYAVALDAEADCQHPDARVLKVVRGDGHAGIHLVDASTQSFDGRNSANVGPNGHGRFASSRGHQIQVRLSAVGRPSLCAPAGGMGDLGAC